MSEESDPTRGAAPSRMRRRPRPATRAHRARGLPDIAHRVDPTEDQPLCDLLRISHRAGNDLDARSWAQLLLQINGVEAPEGPAEPSWPGPGSRRRGRCPPAGGRSRSPSAVPAAHRPGHTAIRCSRLNRTPPPGPRGLGVLLQTGHLVGQHHSTYSDSKNAGDANAALPAANLARSFRFGYGWVRTLPRPEREADHVRSTTSFLVRASMAGRPARLIVTGPGQYE